MTSTAGDRCTAGLAWLASTCLHALLVVGFASASLHGETEPPAGQAVEIATALAGVAGSVSHVADVKPAEVKSADVPKQAETVQAREVEAVEAREVIETGELAVIGSRPPEIAEESPATRPPDARDVQPMPAPKPLEPAKRSARDRAKPREALAAKQPAGNAIDGSAGTSAGGRRGAAKSSPGAINSYAAQVRARILARRPSGGGTSGTTVVRFGVSPGGGLRFASIVRSSGSGALDQKALAAVRGTGFPPPPPGATSAQLTFSIPFHFQ